MNWSPIRKVAVALGTAVGIPTILAALAATNVADLSLRTILIAGGGAFVTALSAYLTPFATNERYARYTAPRK